MHPESSPPWSVQCDIFNGWKQDALRETDLTRQDHAHLQLAAAYHVGFGCHPDRQQAIWRLQQMHSGDPAGKGSWSRVLEALSAFDPVFEPSDIGSHDTYHQLFAECLQTTVPNLDLSPDVLESHADIKWPNVLHWMVAIPSHKLPHSLSASFVSSTRNSKALMSLLEVSSPDVWHVAGMQAELFGTPLHWAVRCGNLRLTKLFLDAGADINARWTREALQTNVTDASKLLVSYSALDLAAQWHFPEIVQLLLEHGAETYGGIRYDKTVIEQHHSASLIGTAVAPFARHFVHGGRVQQASMRTITAFANHGISFGCQDSKNNNVLRLAFSHCDQEDYILDGLIQYSNACDWSWLEELLPSMCQQASIRRCSEGRIRLALSVIGDPNVLDGVSGNNGLHCAALSSSEAVAQQLLAHARIRPDEVNRAGRTALMLAAETGAVSVAILLIRSGVSVEQSDASGRTALCIAIESRQIDMVSFLMDAQAETSWEISHYFEGFEEVRSETVLTLAAVGQKREYSMLKKILDNCENCRSQESIDQQDEDGWTALHQAVWYGDFEGLHALLELGACASIVAKREWEDGETAEGLAKRLWAQLTLIGDGYGEVPWLEKGLEYDYEAYKVDMSKMVAHLT